MAKVAEAATGAWVNTRTGGGIICPHLFFADSVKTAARRGVIFYYLLTSE